MKENYEVCHCMSVSYADIEGAMYQAKSLGEVEAAFQKVQEITSCSTGCGGCHDKVLDIIADIMSGK
ncbi:MAG: (2Fe-2S)-binding protein [Ruminococcus sp.]|nr:(2Fe-2S)-binding protein [Ruminococcus sp.]